MRRFLSLLINESKMRYVEMKQYWFETIGGVALVTLIFLSIFYGIKSFVLVSNDEANLDGLLFGYIMFHFFSRTCYSVIETFASGTHKGFLEQLYMAPEGFALVLIIKVIVALMHTFSSTIILAYLAMWLSGNWINLNFIVLFALLIIATPSALGLGLVLGGFMLVFKRIGVLHSMLSIGVLTLVAVPALPVNFTSFLPLAPGATFARMTALHHEPITAMNLTIVLLNSAIYLLIGLVVLRLMERVAKRKNLLGQY